MATIPVAKLGVTLKFEDGSEALVFEGDIVENLAYSDGTGVKLITGAVRVISAATRAQNTGPITCPPEPYVQAYITPNTLVIDSSEENDAILTSISIGSIISVDKVVTAAEAADAGSIVVGPGSQYKTLAEVVSVAPAGAVVKLLEGEYTDTLNITKSLKLYSAGGAVMKGAITVTGPDPTAAAASTTAGTAAAEPLVVHLDGLTLTDDALISISNADEFVMENCEVSNYNLTEKTMPIAVKTENPMLLRIENNYFGDQVAYSYNLIDVYAYLKDGSSISGNEFSDQCCSHNQISLYNVDNGAVVNINDNHAAVSKNMIRIGFKGTPTATVIMNGNSYDETDDDPSWAGLFLVQPYGMETVTFAGLTIDVSETIKPAGQLGYLYAGPNDTPFTETSKPVIIVDGVKIDIPDCSPART